MSWYLWTSAGVGLFLLGMKGLGERLSALIGERLGKALERATRTPARGMAAGAVCTALLQSSDATNCLTIELMNRRRLSLRQGAALMMGAHVGTTLTGHLIAWNAGGWGVLLILPGALIRMLGGKRDALRVLGDLMSGLGVMFLGMELAGLGCAQANLAEADWAKELMRGFSRPGTALVLSALLTAGLQSSSAFVGLMQTAMAAGALPADCALWLAAGGALGSCATELLIAADASEGGRRAAVFYLLFNVLGVTISLCASQVLPVEEWLRALSGGQGARYLAHANTAIRGMEALAMAPFLGRLTALSERLAPGRDQNARSLRLRDA